MASKPDQRRSRSAPTGPATDRPVQHPGRETGARVGVLAAVAVAVAVAVGIGFVVGGDAETEPGPAEGADTADLAQFSGLGATSPPPWPAPPEVSARAQAAGLSLGPMGMAEHYHVHLDVIVNGRSVPVPADLGVDPASGAMTGLHTHTADGIVHIEASQPGEVFTLGQLFTEWDVRLTDTQLGGLRASPDNELVVYVNGDPVRSDVATTPLAEHQQIAVVYGTTDEPVDVPTGYDFGPDL